MVRPKKATVDFFPHFVNHGETMFNVEAEFGNDGYAFWFKLLELLGRTEHHFYDCNKPKKWRYLLSKTRFNEDDANRILDLLAELEAIDKELWSLRIVWSANFVKNLGSLYSRREINPYTKEDIRGLCTHKLPVSGVSVDIYPHSIVEESTVEESTKSGLESPDDDDQSFKVDDVQYKAAKYLRDRVLENNSRARVPQDSPEDKLMQKWALEMDRLNRIGTYGGNSGYSWEEIKAIISFSQDDTFWRSNILSPGKLREKIVVLENQMKRGEQNGEVRPGYRPSKHDWAAEGDRI